ncbi:MAG: hypothetical protein AB1664_06060, partial [Thermodesulfobacteriota bacterium]
MRNRGSPAEELAQSAFQTYSLLLGSHNEYDTRGKHHEIGIHCVEWTDGLIRRPTADIGDHKW